MAVLAAGSAVYRVLVLPVFLWRTLGGDDGDLMPWEAEQAWLNIAAVAFTPLCVLVADHWPLKDRPRPKTL